MPRPSHSTQLAIGPSAKLFDRPHPLTIKQVKSAFKTVLETIGAKKVGVIELRKIPSGFPTDTRYSWLCFKWEPVVSFLQNSSLTEKRYGFVLLVEHKNLLGVFARGIAGIEAEFGKSIKLLRRDKLMHLWGNSARYEKLSAKRMAMGNTELLGVRYEARDLEASMPTAGAGRSIPTTFQLSIDGEESRAITPSVGRIQKAGDRIGVSGLVHFVDEVAQELAANHTSPFLGSFSVPIELADLPSTVRPTGVLLDWPELQDFLVENPDWTPHHLQENRADLEHWLSQVYLVTAHQTMPKRWICQVGNNEQLQLKRLTSSYSLSVKGLDGWSLNNSATGENKPIAKWFHHEAAYRVAFSDPEYFYTDGKLYRRASFQDDAKQVSRFLEAKPFLVGVSSEKGDTNAYTPLSQHFDPNSIFRRLEQNTAQAYDHFVCSDLNDEWADYIGISVSEIAFFHCKHKPTTAGASAFHEVIAQAQKNLGRVKFHSAEIATKLNEYQNQPLWVSTKGIDRLVRGAWPQAIATSAVAVGDPNTTWKVVLVVSALSKTNFETEKAKANLEPHFVQLVWLLSSFISMCRERDARAAIWCLP